MPISKALSSVQGPVSSGALSMAQEEFGAPDNVRFTFGGMVDSSWIREVHGLGWASNHSITSDENCGDNVGLWVPLLIVHSSMAPPGGKFV